MAISHDRKQILNGLNHPPLKLRARSLLIVVIELNIGVITDLMTMFWYCE